MESARAAGDAARARALATRYLRGVSARAGGCRRAPAGRRRHAPLRRRRRDRAAACAGAGGAAAGATSSSRCRARHRSSTARQRRRLRGRRRDCCSGACAGGRCAPAACRGEGAACASGADCCSFVCAPDPAGDGDARLREPGRLLVGGQSCANAGACCALGCAGGVCARRGCAPAGGAVRRRAGLLRRRVHGGHVRDGPDCRPAGEPCAKADECCGRSCADRNESGVDDLRAAGRVPGRRRNLRDGRRLLQRALRRRARRRHALPGAARLPAGARAVHGRQGMLLGPLRAVGGRPEPMCPRAAAASPSRSAARRARRAARASATSGPKASAAARSRPARSPITAASSASCA